MKSTLCPISLQRKAAVSSDYLVEMEAKSTIKYIDELRIKRDILYSKKQQLITILEQEIFINRNKSEICKILINLKRDVFNDRYQRILGCDIESINSQIKEDLESYKECIKKIINLNKLASDAFIEENIVSRKILQKVYSEEIALLNGSIYINTSIFNKLNKYESIPVVEHNASIRKLDFTLCKLLTRAVLKPSPFSTFAHVGLVEWIENSKEDLINRSDEYRTVAQINHVHILRIFNKLLDFREVKKRLSFRLNQSIKLDGNKFSVVMQQDDPAERPKVFRTKDVFLNIPASKVIISVYEYMKQQKREISYDELKQQLLKNLTAEKADSYIDNFLKYGFIDYSIKLSEYNNDILKEFIEVTQKNDLLDIPLVKAIVSNIEKLKKLLDQYNTERNYIVKLGLYKEIKISLEDIFKMLKIEYNLTNQILYEDSILINKGFLDINKNKELIEVLHILSALSPVFDVAARGQTLFAAKFKEKYGNKKIPTSNTEVITMLTEANQEFRYMWENEWEIRDNIKYPKTIVQLDRLKRKFKEYIINLYNSNGEAEEISIDKEYLKKEIVDNIPSEYKKRKSSNDFFLQIYNKNEQNKYVLNNTYAGYLTYFSRFLDYFVGDYDSESFNTYLENVFDSSNIIAEINEAYGFNANVHSALSKVRFTFPGSVNPDSKEGFTDLIKWENVHYVYNPEQNHVNLYHEKYGEFAIKFLGSLMPLLLPGISGLLHSNFSNIKIFGDITSMFPKEKGKIQYYPRISIGNLVLSRRKWIIPVSMIPKQENGMNEFSYFMKINYWLQDHNLPYEIFMRQELNEYYNKVFNGERGDNIDMTLRKPQYINFHNPQLVRLFEKAMGDIEYFIFEETLPTVEKGKDVREYIIEISNI